MSRPRPVPGRVIADRFFIDRYTGGGGMGDVFLARDLCGGSAVALKVLRVRNPDRNPDRFRRFAREVKVLAELRHPGIVSYVAHGQTEEGRPFLAMEWLEGEDLSLRLARGALSIAESLLLVQRAAEALSAAHRRGVVHRDLKPSNMFLRGGDIDRVTLLDFGLARRMVDITQTTHTGALVGTPEYMAPEQARGEPDLGPSADIFSLGCVLYECLTGRPPFVGEDVAAVLAKILFESPQPARTLRSEVPSALDALLTRMLTRVPAERPQDAAALLQELARIQADADDAPPSMTPSVPSVRRGMAAAELRLVSVVVASAPRMSVKQTLTPEPDGSTADAGEVTPEARAARDALALFGAQVEWLADGSLVAALSQAGSATDQAVRAARCALVVLDHWPDARVALSMGRSDRRQRGLVGEAIDRAVRLLRAAQDSPDAQGVWLDEVSAGLLDPRFVLVQVGARPLLQGERVSIDETRPLLGRPAVCIGREHELTMLEAILASCIEEPASRAVLVTAPPGMGKSCLRRELLRRLTARGADLEVFLGRGDVMWTGAPYSLLRNAVLRCCGLGGAETPEVQLARLGERVRRHMAGPDAQRTVELLAELCGVHSPDNGGQQRADRPDPKAVDDQIGVAFVEWLRAECAVRPVLLVLEDLQWGDQLTMKIVEAALRELADHPLMVLALGRSEVSQHFPKLWAGRVQEIPLRGLSRKAGERFATQVLSQVFDRPPEPDLVSRIVERAGGNALYLEELIRAAAQGGGDAAPETVLVMLQAQLLGLAPSARQLLRAASVYGETFWRGGLLALLGLSPDDREIDRLLEELIDAELIERLRESRLPGEVEYRFRHALVREAAYGLLTEEDRLVGQRLARRFLAGPLDERWQDSSSISVG